MVSARAEPRSFNRLMARDATADLIATLTQARLVRINMATQEVEPWLAERWTKSDDGLRYTVTLRSSVTFSDGQPFTAADVVFSFEAVHDEKVGSILADSLQTGGKPVKVVAQDPRTVVVTFAAPFAPGLRILDNLPILPKHKLAAALEAGTFQSAWGLSTPVSDIVGLGPFVLAGYTPGQRIVLHRNPKYWRTAPDGKPLPYLDAVTVEIIPDTSAEIARLEAGQIDMMISEIAPEAYAPLKRAADAGRVQLLDLGVALVADSFWFNLKPGALGSDPRAAWLQKDELRRAVSLAVDRKAFADTVFFGAGVPVYGPETEANKKWYWTGVTKDAYDPEAARKTLATIGLADRNDDGILEDAGGRPARFTLITQKGRPQFERGASVVRDELKRIGVVVDVVTLDSAALIDRITSAKYDAVYFSAPMTDTDPADNPDFWFSAGTMHLWNMAQKSPATQWERRIDELMMRQMASPDDAERKRLFDQVQQIFAEHLPVVYFVAPRIYVAASSRVTNLTPAVQRPQLLWTPDTVAVTR
ncbi:MAG: ABC transporter substrate-binding protein [Acidobacteria bacterium]|nr:ABC transporter substrate-binding protein [Acidobacteriota bacterium]